jgi:hypothetical protein
MRSFAFIWRFVLPDATLLLYEAFKNWVCFIYLCITKAGVMNNKVISNLSKNSHNME